MLRRAAASRPRSGLTVVAALVAAALVTSVAAAQSTTDPRFTLTPGLTDAGVAASGIELLKNTPKPAGFFNPASPGDFGFVNSDLAFEGKHAFIGNFNGFQIYDISNPASPALVTTVVCPGGQGEVSVYKNLLFMSAEETRARTDCGSPGVPTGDPLRFRGVRVFDISNIAAPVQVAAVQTCRGSHTHTLLKSKHDDANVYVYVNGTGGVRSATELASCKPLPAGTNLTTPHFDNTLSQFRIEVIKVPLAAPNTAAVVGEARLMGDPATGQINVLQNGPPQPLHPSGVPYSPSPSSDSCHDITVFPALDIAAGACEGNGILIDISDPANPKRTAVAQDNNFSYWHGATFSNDGKTVVFTDEWGGGTAARCRTTDQLNWGANAIYDIVGGALVFRSYYKMPAAQTLQENCVSHLPSLVPVPGRDIMVQAWYQAGVSMIDFTDSANPVEIGYWDRGPISGTSLVLGGLWSAYWYNGSVYGSEIARGFDSFKLLPTDDLSANEIEAANEVVFDRLTPQHQPQYVNEASFAVVRAYRDQLVRAGLLKGQKLENVDKFLDRAERAREEGKDAAARAYLRSLAFQLRHEGDEFDAIVAALFDLAEK
jgi:LVIVD repeat